MDNPEQLTEFKEDSKVKKRVYQVGNIILAKSQSSVAGSIARVIGYYEKDETFLIVTLLSGRHYDGGTTKAILFADHLKFLADNDTEYALLLKKEAEEKEKPAE